MVFNSLHFLLFFSIVFGCFFLIPHRFRWMFMLGASYYFYMAWKAKYALLMVVITLIDYISAIQLHKSNKPSTQKTWLLISLLANLGILMVFKYYDFFIENINALLESMGSKNEIYALRLILPLGVSFHTFQSMAYTIDVFKKRITPEKHLGYFSLFIVYFPQLVAGPIERAGNILNQLKSKVEFNYDRISDGFKRMIWGFFKKVVIADRLAVIVDSAYQDPSQHDGITMLVATYAFAFQIYCDFSGYTDIAIGAAKMFGVDMSKNFKTPYVSTSITEFWTRWHISLSTWFRDYLYIPLGGSRKNKMRTYLNILIVFLVSGFWHGAAWTFIIWGGIHGIITVFEHAVVGKRTKQKNLLKLYAYRFLMFNIICFAWIFFRSEDMTKAIQVLNSFTQIDPGSFFQFMNGYGKNVFLLITILWLVFIFADNLVDKRLDSTKTYSGTRELLLYSFLTALILTFGYFGKTEFIYFQF